MAKILFGQDLIADVEADLRFAVGKPGLPYAYNVNFEVLKSLIAGSGSVVTVENTTVYDPLEIYEAGNIFVSFVNENSSSPFDTAALYRSRETTEAGISPEDSLYNVDTNPSGKWEYQGTSVISQDGGLGAIFYNNEDSIKAITGYKNGDNVVDIETGSVYEYNDAEQIGLKPNNHFGIYGRWRYRFRLIKSDQSTKQTLTSSPKIQDLTADRIPYVSADKSIKSSGFLKVDEVNKRLGVNVNPSTPFHVGDGNQPSYLFDQYNSNFATYSKAGTLAMALITASNIANQRPIMLFERARGTLQYPLNVQINDPLGELLFAGYSQGGMGYGGGIFAYVDGATGLVSVPTRISIVTGSSSSNRAERLTVKASGKIGINNIDPQEQCDVGGNIKATGSIQIGDRQTTASAKLKGTTRYREGAGYSVTEMCMQISATEYAWKEIVRNEW